MSSATRVLHLLSPGAAGSGAAMLRLVGATRRHLPEFEHEVLILGPARWSVIASLVGAGAHRRIPPLFGAPALSARTIRGAIESIGANLLHAWDSESVDIAIGGRIRAPVVATLGAVPPRRGTTPLALDRVEALALGERARRQAVAGGWLHGRVHTVLAPRSLPDQHAGSSPERSRERASLRAAWDVDDETTLIAVVADPVPAADAWLAFEMAARARISGHRLRLLCMPGISSLEGFSHWGEIPELRGMVISDAQAERPWACEPAIDVALLPERSGGAEHGARARPALGSACSGPLSLLWLHAAGVPILSTPDGPLQGVLDPSEFESVAPRPNAGAVALGKAAPRRVDRDHAAVEPHAASFDAWVKSIRELYARTAAAGVSARAHSERAAST